MTSEPGAPQPVRAPARHTMPWALAVAGLVGLAVGVLVVGAAWLLNDSGDRTDTRPISAPERLGDYVLTENTETFKKERDQLAASRLRQRNDRSTERLSQSYGGAGALFRLYSDQEMKDQVTVMVYRAKAPYPPFVPYLDASAARLAKPPQDVEYHGEVACTVNNVPTPQGETPDEDSVQTVSCLRTSTALTVELRPNGDAGKRPAKVAELTDAMWHAVS